MSKIVIAAIIIVVVVGGFFGYKTYKKSYVQNQTALQTQPMQETATITPTADANLDANTVDQTSSPQEQQAQQDLNSLDGSDQN